MKKGNEKGRKAVRPGGKVERSSGFDWVGLSARLHEKARGCPVLTFEDRQDVCQDILVRLVANGALPRVNTKGWVRRAVGNGLKDLIERQVRYRKYVDESVGVDTIGLYDRGELDGSRREIELAEPDRQREWELLQEVWQAVEALPAVQRQVCALVVEGMKEAEIAQVMGCSIGTVKSRFYHARLTLRRKLTARDVTSCETVPVSKRHRDQPRSSIVRRGQPKSTQQRRQRDFWRVDFGGCSPWRLRARLNAASAHGGK